MGEDYGDVTGDYLADVEYPATKHELIDAAVETGAPQWVVERLQRLTREQYDNPGELELELAEPEP